MKELGVKVLSKIENLISEIDKKPKSPPKNKTLRQSANQSRLSANQSRVAPPTNILPPNQSVAQSDPVTQQLSYAYLNTQKKNLQKLVTHAYKQQNEVKNFKVTNKQTLDILKKLAVPPIHQRLDQIRAKKQIKLNQLSQQQKEKEEMSMRPLNLQDYTPEDIYKKYRKMNEEELLSFRNDYDERNQERLKKKHLLQLSKIDKEVPDTIPTIGSHSRNLSQRRNLKKNYSADVFKRMNQDYIDRGERKNQLKSKITEEEGGFQPILCSKSRQLALRHKSIQSFPQHHDHSTHKKCKAPVTYTPKPKRKWISPHPVQKITQKPKKSESSPQLKRSVNRTPPNIKSAITPPPKSKQVQPSPQANKYSPYYKMLMQRNQNQPEVNSKKPQKTPEKTKSKTNNKYQNSKTKQNKPPINSQSFYLTDQQQSNCPYHTHTKTKKKVSPTPLSPIKPIATSKTFNK